jgi:hypothetical protein
MGRSLAGKPDDIQSEIGGVKPETDYRGSKCGLVSFGNRVIAWIATKNRLSGGFEATVDRTRGPHRAARLKHDVGFLGETKKFVPFASAAEAKFEPFACFLYVPIRYELVTETSMRPL